MRQFVPQARDRIGQRRLDGLVATASSASSARSGLAWISSLWPWPRERPGSRRATASSGDLQQHDPAHCKAGRCSVSYLHAPTHRTCTTRCAGGLGRTRSSDVRSHGHSGNARPPHLERRHAGVEAPNLQTIMALYSEMSSDRWRKIERVFFAALDCTEVGLDAFVLRACAGDSDLYLEVKALLEAGARSHGFLETIDAVQASSLLRESAAPEAARVGPYAIVREVGRGGMGVVYLAERAVRDEKAQFDQQVALKLVKRGMDSDAILHRFINERQILARLEHPHIARLLDGGVTDDGQPYFAMEYVAGTPITSFCDNHRLNIDVRLRLFVDACRAVQYAHQNLVVHRDLKPSNVLVIPRPDVPGSGGHVKLLDFGIAKVLGAEGGASDAVVTETDMRVMTPEYAAPEQVRGEPVTTATDVYALGVILYELLSGRRPYQVGRRTFGEIEEAVLQAEPTLPSMAIRRVEEIRHTDGTSETVTPERVSTARGTQPDRLRRRLAGDLDTIVQKALRKEPERRYSSAGALADDLLRHLAGMPVSARKDTLGYRARTFIRRHRAGLAAATLVLVSLAGGLGAALWQARETAQEAAKAEEVKEFLMRLFETSDPDVSKGETITARELLDNGAARIEQELAAQPEVQGEMMRVMGEIYSRLGLYEDAERLNRQALAQFRSLHGETHPDVAHSLHALGTVMREKGDYDGAESLLRESLAMRRRLLARDHPDIAAALQDLAWTLRYKSDYEGAEQLIREALAINRKQFGAEREEVATGLYNLASIRGDRSDYAESERLHREALNLRRKLLGGENLAVAQSLNMLAGALRSLGDVEEAESMYREALAMRRKLLGDAHPAVGASMNDLALVLLTRRAYEEAESLFRQVLANYRARLGEEHPFVATALNNLATTLRDKGDLDAAVATFRDAVALQRKLLGSESVDTAKSLWTLAEALRLSGEYVESERLNREALATRRRLLGDEHREVVSSLNTLGLVLCDRGAFDEAEQHLIEAVALSRKLLGDRHLDTPTSLQNLGYVLRKAARYDDAEKAYRDAREAYLILLVDDHPRVLFLEYELGLLLRDRGDYTAAEQLLRDVLARQRVILGDDHRNTKSTEFSLSRLPNAR